MTFAKRSGKLFDTDEHSFPLKLSGAFAIASSRKGEPATSLWNAAHISVGSFQYEGMQNASMRRALARAYDPGNGPAARSRPNVKSPDRASAPFDVVDREHIKGGFIDIVYEIQ